MRKILISIDFLENCNAMINYHRIVPSLTSLKMLGELTQNIISCPTGYGAKGTFKNLLKFIGKRVKKTRNSCFPVNFKKFFKTAFL